MASEIDVLSGLGPACVLVEKATNEVWTAADLHEAPPCCRFAQDDCLAAAEGGGAVSGPYPGCLQQSGCMEELTHYDLVGQTRHFLVFRPGG